MTSGRTFDDGEDLNQELSNGRISEVLDLQNETISCKNAHAWPFKMVNGKGIYLNDSVLMICGGNYYEDGHEYAQQGCLYKDLSDNHHEYVIGWKDSNRTRFSMVGLNGKIRSLFLISEYSIYLPN